MILTVCSIDGAIAHLSCGYSTIFFILGLIGWESAENLKVILAKAKCVYHKEQENKNAKR